VSRRALYNRENSCNSSIDLVRGLGSSPPPLQAQPHHHVSTNRRSKVKVRNTAEKRAHIMVAVKVLILWVNIQTITNVPRESAHSICSFNKPWTADVELEERQILHFWRSLICWEGPKPIVFIQAIPRRSFEKKHLPIRTISLSTKSSSKKDTNVGARIVVLSHS
jgi:hypothetical protein